MTTPLRAVDHQQLIVADLDRARRDYERLGFFVSPRMRHSMGTSNHLILFDRDFIELFGGFDDVVDPAWKAALGPSMSRRGPGPVALHSDDAEADREALRRAGAEAPEVKTFTRPVPLPGGAEGEVRCSIAGAGNADHPGLAFFYCQQHRPENVWIRDWMRHPNGATGLSSITFAAREPRAHHRTLALHFGVDHVREVDRSLFADVARGAAVEVVPTDRLGARFAGIESVAIDEDRAIAIGVRVADLEGAARVLGGNGVPFARRGRVLAIPPEVAHGAILELRE